MEFLNPFLVRKFKIVHILVSITWVLALSACLENAGDEDSQEVQVEISGAEVGLESETFSTGSGSDSTVSAGTDSDGVDSDGVDSGTGDGGSADGTEPDVPRYLRLNLSLGREKTSFTGMGVDDGDRFVQYCPIGKVVNGIGIYVATRNGKNYISGFKLRCKSLNELGNPEDNGEEQPGIGVTQGSARYEILRPNLAMTGFLFRICGIFGESRICDAKIISREIRGYGTNDTHDLLDYRNLRSRASDLYRRACPDGMVMTGIWGKVGVDLNRLGGSCQRVESSLVKPLVRSLALDSGFDLTFDANTGVDYGPLTNCSLYCPKSKPFITGDNIQWDEKVKGAQFYCGESVPQVMGSSLEVRLSHDDCFLNDVQWDRATRPFNKLKGYVAIGLFMHAPVEVNCMSLIYAPVNLYAAGTPEDPLIRSDHRIRYSCAGDTTGLPSGQTEVFCPDGYVMAGAGLRRNQDRSNLVPPGNINCRQFILNP